MAPNVSVCIPTYNRRELIKETLDSVFAQSYKDFEVVIVDDGSTDGTEQMIADAGYDVRYHWQENAGDADARNTLIKLAKGKYISFLDSDDLLWPDALERMVKAIPDGDDNVIVYGPYTAIDKDGNILRRKKKKLYGGRITEYLFDNILIHSCGSMFPTDVLQDIGGFDTSLPVCSDYDLWLRLSMKHDFVALDKPVFKRRRHEGNISRICFTNRNTEFKVLENFYYNRGGQGVVDKKRAMKRLGKEQYRAARSAIAESMPETATEMLQESLNRYCSFKTCFWLMIAKAQLQIRKRSQKVLAEPVTPSMASIEPANINQIKVAVDFNPVLVNKYSGFYTFGTGLLEGFAQLEDKPELLLFHSGRFTARARKVLTDELNVVAEQKNVAIKMRWLENFWNRFNYPKLQSLTGPFDIYHCLHHLMPPTDGKPRIMTVYDLRRYKIAELYRKSKLGFFESAIKRADHFIAISEATRDDLCEIFSIPENKVDVVPLAGGIGPISLSQSEISQVKIGLGQKFGQEISDYLVVISSPDSRKNIKKMVEAFRAAKPHLPQGLKMLIVGNLPKRQVAFVKDLKAGKYADVVCLGTVDDLYPVLASAMAFVFASLYEGFGIPILEAFACNVPVVTSNSSSMPQVAGNAALYVDPNDTDSIAQAMIKVSHDQQLRDELISLGQEQNAKFSWEKTAQKTVEVYEKLI